MQAYRGWQPAHTLNPMREYPLIRRCAPNLTATESKEATELLEVLAHQPLASISPDLHTLAITGSPLA